MLGKWRAFIQRVSSDEFLKIEKESWNSWSLDLAHNLQKEKNFEPKTHSTYKHFLIPVSEEFVYSETGENCEEGVIWGLFPRSSSPQPHS